MSNYEYLDPISDEEIKYAEGILLPEGQKFDEERRSIIKSMNSCSIEACPGSGKTTVLLAKLIILANRMPFKDRKGICVLTHTNVAIEEIKKRLGEKSEILFQYPNYFGTLQTFVDKYLAIPHYKELFKDKVAFIDDEIVNKTYKNVYLSRQLYGKKMRNRISDDEIVYDFKSNKIKFGPEVIEQTNLDYNRLYMRVKNGFLRYKEAIQLGGLYLDKYHILKELFSSRFKFVFLDEMQDTTKDAFDIIENLFDKEKTSLQYIGDSNQNIFGEEFKWSFDPVLPITESKRYGDEIASFICSLRIDKPNGSLLKGSNKASTKTPHLLVYESGKEDEVLDKFIELIKDYGLDQKKDSIFKAIGAVGRSSGKHIGSYCKEFAGKSEAEKMSFQYLAAKSNGKTSRNKELLNVILRICSNFLNQIGKKINDKPITPQELRLLLLEKEAFNKMKISVYNYLTSSNSVSNLRKNVYDLIKKEFEIEDRFEEKFLSYFHLENQNDEKIENANEHVKDNVKIYIDTVHGVKGETHTATLFLETFKRSNDLTQIKDYLFKERKPRRKMSDGLANKIKICYVGFSRPTDLLCLAMEKSEGLNKILDQNRGFLDGKVEIINL